MHWQKGTQMHSEKSDPDKHTKAWKRTCKRARRAQMAFTSPVCTKVYCERAERRPWCSLYEVVLFFFRVNNTRTEKIYANYSTDSALAFQHLCILHIFWKQLECMKGFVSITHRLVSIHKHASILRKRHKLQFGQVWSETSPSFWFAYRRTTKNVCPYLS